MTVTSTQCVRRSENEVTEILNFFYLIYFSEEKYTAPPPSYDNATGAAVPPAGTTPAPGRNEKILEHVS